jgi:hypothetical protein
MLLGPATVPVYVTTPTAPKLIELPDGETPHGLRSARQPPLQIRWIAK